MTLTQKKNKDIEMGVGIIDCNGEPLKIMSRIGESVSPMLIVVSI